MNTEVIEDRRPELAPLAGYTPGPWGVEQTENTNWIGPMRADGRKVNEIVADTDREELKPECIARNDADARLIAAAPEMAHVLKVIVDDQECYCADNVANRDMCGWCQATIALDVAIKG